MNKPIKESNSNILITSKQYNLESPPDLSKIISQKKLGEANEAQRHVIQALSNQNVNDLAIESDIFKLGELKLLLKESGNWLDSLIKQAEDFQKSLPLNMKEPDEIEYDMSEIEDLFSRDIYRSIDILKCHFDNVSVYPSTDIIDKLKESLLEKALEKIAEVLISKFSKEKDNDNISSLESMKDIIKNDFNIKVETYYYENKLNLSVDIERKIDDSTDISQRLPDSSSFTFSKNSDIKENIYYNGRNGNLDNHEIFTAYFRFPENFRLTDGDCEELENISTRTFLTKLLEKKLIGEIEHKEVQCESTLYEEYDSTLELVVKFYVKNKEEDNQP
ncbi:MAG: hypothetical protein HRT47_13475 [Candidatus Caenarcaniphilales bacterium]|nr:hypothetical protein [Candidatus Caenarcaniphilales bacterium]